MQMITLKLLIVHLKIDLKTDLKIFMCFLIKNLIINTDNKFVKLNSKSKIENSHFILKISKNLIFFTLNLLYFFIFL